MRISCWSSDVCSSDLPTISQAGPWRAGGSVRRLIMCLPQDSDFDFFFKDQAQFDAFCDEMKLKGAERVSENDFNITFKLPAVKAKPIEDDVFTKDRKSTRLNSSH